MDILSPGALQSLGLARDFLDTSPLDMTDINDTVCQHSLSLPDINPEPSELQGLGERGPDLGVLPELVASPQPVQGLPDLQAGHSATSSNTNHTDSNISVPLGGQDNAMSPRKRLAPQIIVFPAADGQGKRQRRRFNDAKRQKVAQVRKDGACMRCHLSKTPVRRTLVYPCLCSSEAYNPQCSTGQPCEPCFSRWLSLNNRSTKLQWMSCVPYSWKDVNIFIPGSASFSSRPTLADTSRS